MALVFRTAALSIKAATFSYRTALEILSSLTSKNGTPLASSDNSLALLLLYIYLYIKKMQQNIKNAMSYTLKNLTVTGARGNDK